MLKELTVPEALQLLVEVSKEENLALAEGWFWDRSINDKISNKLSGVVFDMEEKADRWFVCGLGHFKHFAIEVPDKYRYMNTEEVQNWISCVGYKNHQVVEKNNTDGWRTVHEKAWHIARNPRKYQYRTVELIDNEVHYGEPQEFKAKV